LEILETYGWAAQALELATGAEEAEAEVEAEVEAEAEVEVEVMEVWAAASVKPAARARVVSCMVYSRKTFAIGLERAYSTRKKQCVVVRRELCCEYERQKTWGTRRG
jgi:hypothetical protein